jgi:hypothetical protein
MLLAKVNARGTVWSSHYIRPRVLAYRMERFGSTKSCYSEIEEIVVQPAKEGGWAILLDGEPIQHEKYKGDAQRQAELLLDNPRDSSGWLVQNTGRIF